MVVQDAVCARYHPSNPRPPGAPTKTDCSSFIPHLQSWYSIPSPFEYLPQKLIARRIRFRFQEDFLAELSEFKTYVSSLVPIFIVCCPVINTNIHQPTTPFLPPPFTSPTSHSLLLRKTLSPCALSRSWPPSELPPLALRQSVTGSHTKCVRCRALVCAMSSSRQQGR